MMKGTSNIDALPPSSLKVVIDDNPLPGPLRNIVSLEIIENSEYPEFPLDLDFDDTGDNARFGSSTNIVNPDSQDLIDINGLLN